LGPKNYEKHGAPMPYGGGPIGLSSQVVLKWQ